MTCAVVVASAVLLKTAGAGESFSTCLPRGMCTAKGIRSTPLTIVHSLSMSNVSTEVDVYEVGDRFLVMGLWGRR